MPISYMVIMIRSAGANFPTECSDRNLIVKIQCVCETDVAPWQLQSFSGCISHYQDTTHIDNPVIAATVSATQHSSGCISVCPASFIPFTVIVTDPHSTYSAHYLTFPIDTSQSQNVCLEQQLGQFHWH